ncbi:ABC transporter permease [Ornithinibacillus xuwenensis]|uniref:ABC transporter permease n=1 Tax=Ornithinibacillus xuwenensis TaxID=3144668 RepID=A0ABU9XHM4_9BACI
MIWKIIKKQALLFLRNPQQLVLLIALPMILIMILGTALGSVMNGEGSPINLKLAFIENDDEQEQVERFLTDLAEKLPPEAVTDIEATISNMMPVDLLKKSLDNKEVDDFIQVSYFDPSEREALRKEESYTAIIEIPEQFTYKVLEAMFLGNIEPPELQVTYNEEEQVGTSVLTSFLTQFQTQLTKGNFLGENGIDLSSIQIDESIIEGELIAVNEKNPITSSAYYTVGMVVMNVLFIAGAIGYYAFHEKEIKVFNRIIIADVSRWVYFISILLSGTIFAFIQSMLIFTFSRIVFGIIWPNLFSFLVVTLAFSFAVGGLAVLLTALNYRVNSETITNFFMNISVTLLAVLGGSFYPIGDYLPLIQTIGNMTPNGASLTAYVTLLRGDGIAAIDSQLIYLVLFGIVMVIIAGLCFPKRGVSA